MSEAVTRRAWLSRLAPAALDAVGRGIERRLPSSTRPPGAVGEMLFQSTCTRCGDCSTACPHLAVFVYKEEAGLNAGTPVMLADRRPCHMCEGFPCAKACETGALVVPETKTWKLGVARIRADLCIAFAGPECGACAGLCPDGVGALTMERLRPSIDAPKCVGCGLCIEACPTAPKAIELDSQSDA